MSDQQTKIIESYGRLKDNDRSFDRQFWQARGVKAIFDAAFDLIKDYLLLKEGYADQPRIEKSIEFYGKVPVQTSR